MEMLTDAQMDGRGTKSDHYNIYIFSIEQVKKNIDYYYYFFFFIKLNNF